MALSSGWTKRAVRASAHREKSTDFGVTAASTALLAGCGLPCCALVAGWAAPPEAAAHAAWRPGRCSSGARAAAQGSSARESAGAARMPPHSRDSQPATRIHSEHGEPRKHGGSAHRREEERRRRYGRARRTHKDAPATTYYKDRWTCTKDRWSRCTSQTSGAAVMDPFTQGLDEASAARVRGWVEVRFARRCGSARAA